MGQQLWRQFIPNRLCMWLNSIWTGVPILLLFNKHPCLFISVSCLPVFSWSGGTAVGWKKSVISSTVTGISSGNFIPSSVVKNISCSRNTWFESRLVLDVRGFHNPFEAEPCSITRVYPKVSGLAAWSENCKGYRSLPLGAVVSLTYESV
jgi:hypothetical protein